MRHTALFEEYGTYPGIRMIEFGQWELPVHFAGGITAEHHAVRQKAGLFDVSHMGECKITGPLATSYLDYVVTNSVASMRDGEIIYTLMCYPNGTVVDDLIIYRMNAESYWVVMNASNVEKDLLWITKENPWASSSKEIPTIEDYSDRTSQLALQGPLAEEILVKLCPRASELTFFTFFEHIEIGGVSCILSRNGYTGEDGFEMYCASEEAVSLWKALMEAGSSDGLLPCGLGSRDTLRLEAKLPLYGHEISDEITPLEANLKAFVKLEKEDFVGKDALSEQHIQGIPRSLRGIEMLDASVPRNGYRVFLEDTDIGFVTSGAKSPTLGIFCGYVLIDRNTSLKFGDIVDIEVHGKRKRARIVKTPFYKRTPPKGN